MNEENDSEEELIRIIKEAAENFGLIKDINISPDEIFEEDKSNDLPIKFLFSFIYILLTQFTGPNFYDNTLQRIIKNKDINYYKELEKLIISAKKSDAIRTNELLSKFLYIPAIYNFIIPEGRRMTSKNVMEEEMLFCKNKLQNEKVNILKVAEFFVSTISTVRKKTDQLLKTPRRFKQEIESYINIIKNHFEITKYFTGLILGLFEIVNKKTTRKISWYFPKRKSSPHHYFPPKNYDGKKLWLRDYLNHQNFKKKYSSIKYIYEEWLFKQIKDIRIHEAHGQIDINQNKLTEGIYLIEIDGELKEFTLEDILNLEKIKNLLIVNSSKYVIGSKSSGSYNLNGIGVNPLA